MEKFWFNVTAVAFTICTGSIGADALRSSGNPHYSFWFSPLAFCGYTTGVIGVVSLACVLGIIWSRRRLRGPRGAEFSDVLTPGGTRPVLGEDDLRDIRRISAASRYTRAQKQRLLAPYYGRLIRLTGTVREVGEWTGCSRVTVRTGVRRFTALMDFSDRHTFDLYLSILVPKRRVTVVGEIEQIEENTILLKNCAVPLL